MGCLSNKTANILLWLLQFIYYTQVATESIFVTEHQTKTWESEEEEEWVRENTLCAFTSFAIQLSKASFSLGTNWEQLPMLKARSALSLPASHLDHQGTASFLTFSSGRFFAGLKNRKKCGKPNANVEITGRRKNFCMFYSAAYCPKFIMVNAITGRLRVKRNPQSLPKISFRPPSSFCAFALTVLFNIPSKPLQKIPN